MLPFSITAGDSTPPYLADGATEGLIAALGRVNGLRVIARSVAFRYRGPDVDPRNAAHDLGVGTVLTGMVRQNAGALRVAVELTRADGTMEWSRTIDRGAGELAAAEAEIIQAVAGRLRVALGAAAKGGLDRRARVNPEAHDLYLRGRFFWTQRSQEGMRRAIELYREAIDKDPSNTFALSGLADAYA